ncbi:MAG TPA: cation:proton antiporter [Longimicrobium sp.]|jgi:monovalent cation:proton antiporter-2 (CPA2) family protein
MPKMIPLDPLPLGLLILAAAVLVVPLFNRFRVSPVVGYIVAGAAIGPHGMGWIADAGAVEELAHIGVVFLLFSIGLDLSLGRLREMRRLVLGLGVVQMAATTLLALAALRLMGVGGSPALVLASGVAFSSTAIVLRLFDERRLRATALGRAGLAVLLLQDLAVIPLLAVVPLLGGGEGLGRAIAVALLKAAVTVAVILVMGRVFLSTLLRGVAKPRVPELFTAVVLLLSLGVGFLTERMGLSMALGAFLAGLLIAETEFRHQVQGDIAPFQGLLLALFFMSVGMSIDFGELTARAPLVVALALGLVVLKTAVLGLAARAFGLAAGPAAQLGLTLSQGGEFALVLFTLASSAGVLDARSEAVGVLVVTITMGLTPLLATAGAAAARHLAVRGGRAATADAPPAELEGHVLIAGFGRAGQTVARLLEEQGVAYLALDMDPERVREAHARGLPVYFGDASRPEVLRAVRAAAASAAAITLDDPDAATRAVAAVRREARKIPVVVRARYTGELQALGAAGATVVVPELIEGSLQLGASVLESLGETREGVDRIVDAFRDREYTRLGGLAGRSGRGAAGGIDASPAPSSLPGRKEPDRSPG